MEIGSLVLCQINTKQLIRPALQRKKNVLKLKLPCLEKISKMEIKQRAQSKTAVQILKYSKSLRQTNT